MQDHAIERTTSRRRVLKTTALAGAALLGGSTITGQVGGRTTDGDIDGHGIPIAKGLAGGRANLVEIVAQHDHDTGEHLFEFSADEIGSGWTTVRFDNQTDNTHFAYLAKLPQEAIEDAGHRDLLDFYIEHVTRPFQWFMDTLIPGKDPDPDDLSDRYTNLEDGAIFPAWFGTVLPSGGVGMTTGGSASASTVQLDPGKYIVECYAKNDEGDFHSYHGMIDLLTVGPARSDAPDPGLETTLDLALSTNGIDAPDAVLPGQHTVAVHIEDQRIYEHLLGHDVHLIRFDGGTTAEDANGWMNWMDPDGLVSDGAEPGAFMGGVQTILTPGLLAGEESETAYVHATLQPGSYAWVSEVPGPADKGFLKEFSVTQSARSDGIPPADPGESKNWGPVGEHPDDDLSERAANSNMPDDLKTIFDALANVDVEDSV